MTDRYAVVGNPVGHSLSPRIHAAFAAATGEDLVYEKLLAPVDGFADTVSRFFQSGGRGVNVTVPFKEEAFRWVDRLDRAARLAGAVNTIVTRPDGFHGHNTDGAGLVRDLAMGCGVGLAGARILLLGAGGAARGALHPLLEAAPESLTVANRTPARADDLAAVARRSAGSVSVRSAGLADLAGRFDVVINATSAGLTGQEQPAAVNAGAVAGAFCYDMIYAAGPDPAATPFCRWAAAHGARQVRDGLGMLVQQAALAFELWRGVVPPVSPVLELLRGRRV